ncbi:MAG: glycosyltransferase family 39 protein [Bacteroidia bacterium]
MAKTSKKTKTSSAPVPELAKPSYFPVNGFRKQLYLLLIIGFVFYANSLMNEYALDDGPMIKENNSVLAGTKGLKEIFTKHSMYAFYKKYNAVDEFQGGRYRPLSIATFAVEQQFFGMKVGDEVEVEDHAGQYHQKSRITGFDAFYVDVEYPGKDGNPVKDKVFGAQISTFHNETFPRHLDNVLIYLLTIGFVLYLMREQIFRNNPDLGFLCALVFAIHPIHTEVVDNIKSRDELMALLFAVMTFVFVFKYSETKKTSALLAGLLSLFCALLSKEYGIVMFVILPLFFYLVLQKKPGESIRASLPYFGIMAVFYIIRVIIIPPGQASHFHATEVLNNQYIAASGFAEKFCTKVYMLARYLWMQVYPNSLCVDYSFKQIPFITFSDWHFWISLFLHIGIVAITIMLTMRRHILSFFLWFYLAHLFIISNLLTEIGTTLSERLIYSPSFAFCILAGYGLYYLLQKLPDFSKQKAAALGLSAVLLVVCGGRVMSRNADWKNDATLFTHDLAISPNSVLVCGNAAKGYLDMSGLFENKDSEKVLIYKAIPPLRNAIRLHPKYVTGFTNLAYAYFKLGMFDSTYANLMKGKQIAPNNSLIKQYAGLFFQKGLDAARAKDIPKAIEQFKKAVDLEPNSAEMWANLGGAFFTVQDFNNARISWDNALKLDPNHQEAARGYNMLIQMKKAPARQ